MKGGEFAAHSGTGRSLPFAQTMPLAKPAFTTMTFPTRLLPTHSPRDNPESTRAQLQKYAPTTSGSKAFPQLVASLSQQPGHSGNTGNVANITSSPQQCANKGNTYEKTNCGPGERMPRHTMGCRTQSCEDAYLCGTGISAVAPISAPCTAQQARSLPRPHQCWPRGIPQPQETGAPRQCD